MRRSGAVLGERDGGAESTNEAGIHRRRGAHAGRATRGRTLAGTSRRPRRALDPRARRTHGHRPGRGRRRRVRQRRQHRPPGRRHRAHVLAGGRDARARAGHHHRPAVRFRAAGDPLRRAGGDVGNDGPRRRRWRAEHEPDPDLRRHARRPGLRARDAVLGVARLEGALRRPGGLAVPRRGDDRREVGHLARRHGAVRGRVARARDARARRRALRARDRAARRVHVRRRTARAQLGQDPIAADAGRGRSPHRRGRQPDQRRVGGVAHRQRASVEGPRAHPSCASIT